MAYLRLFKRIRIAPGLAINISKGGPSLSVGVRGAHLTVGRSGIRKTVSVPGTGMFFTSREGWHTGAHTGRQFHEAPPLLKPWDKFVNGIATAIAVGVVAVVILAIIGWLSPG